MIDGPPPSRDNAELTPEQRARRRIVRMVMYWLAGISIGGLILSELAGLGGPTSRLVLIGGLVAAGTVAMILQGERRCPGCGVPYGYAPRLVQPNLCRRCGATFPILPDD